MRLNTASAVQARDWEGPFETGAGAGLAIGGARRGRERGLLAVSALGCACGDEGGPGVTWGLPGCLGDRHPSVWSALTALSDICSGGRGGEGEGPRCSKDERSSVLERGQGKGGRWRALPCTPSAVDDRAEMGSVHSMDNRASMGSVHSMGRRQDGAGARQAGSAREGGQGRTLTSRGAWMGFPFLMLVKSPCGGSLSPSNVAETTDRQDRGAQGTGMTVNCARPGTR